jgi:hypothetical protein
MKAWNRDNNPQAIRRAHGLMTLFAVGVLAGAGQSVEAQSMGSCTDPRYPNFEANGPGGEDWCQSDASGSDGGAKTTFSRIFPASLEVNNQGLDIDGNFIPCELSQLGEHRRVDFYQVTKPGSSDACSVDTAYNQQVSAEAINFVCVNRRPSETDLPERYWKPLCGSNFAVTGTGAPLCWSETAHFVYQFLLEFYPPPTSCSNYSSSSGTSGSYSNPYTRGALASADSLRPFIAGSNYGYYSPFHWGYGGGRNASSTGSSKVCPSSVSALRLWSHLFGQPGGIPVIQQGEPFSGTIHGCSYSCLPGADVCSRVK